MSKKKPSTLFQKYQAISRIGTEVDVPYDTFRVIGAKTISIVGADVCIGGGDSDYVSLVEAQEAVAWYVTQLGGKVTWNG